MVELLSTKLFIPRPRSDRVSRPRLIERLNAGLDRKITLITAPAGFGKTTLLSEWIPHSPRPVAWFSLDEGDNSPARFWAYVIAALQTLSPELGKGVQPLLRSLPTPAIKSILTGLLNEIHTFEQPFVFIFDDYHLIENTEIDDELAYLIDHQPPNLHLFITTRIDPGLPLSRLRARNQLVELRANDLRFTADEAGIFLTRAMRLNLSAEEVASLEARTEGWIAGLQIAALSMQGHADMPGFIKTFSGSHRHILGYLADEVLSQRSKDTLNFLLQTSILERLCGPLCDAITGDSNGQMLLENLEHANLFITPLDHQGMWYRYHHLFAEVLQLRLQQVYGERIAELHRRASDWYESQGMIEDGIRHSLAGADYESAARLIARLAPLYIRKGEMRTLLAWMEDLPESLIFSSEELLVYQGWCLYFTSQIERGKACVEKAKGVVKADSPTILRGCLAYLYAQQAIIDENLPAAHQLGMEALELIGQEDLFVRSLTLSALSGFTVNYGESGEAISMLREAARIGEALEHPLATMAAYALLIHHLNWRGELREAQNIYEKALALYVDSRGQPLPIAGMVYAAAARLAYEVDDRERLRRCIASAAALQKFLGLPRLSVEIIYAQILEAWITREYSAALSLARQGRQLTEHQGLRRYDSRFAAMEINIFLKLGDLEMVSKWMESTPPFDTGDLLHIEENIVYARCLLMQNCLDDAQQFLDMLQKAVMRAEYNRYLIAVLILKALLFHRRHEFTQSRQHLEQALQYSVQQGYRRVFLDEGEEIRSLLDDFHTLARQRISEKMENMTLRLLIFTEELLADFPGPGVVAKSENAEIREQLSERELNILQLIATGHSNKEIAEILVVAVSTVKSHINNLYGKIGATRRTQAIVIARDSGLLSE